MQTSSLGYLLSSVVDVPFLFVRASALKSARTDDNDAFKGDSVLVVGVRRQAEASSLLPMVSMIVEGFREGMECLCEVAEWFIVASLCIR